MPSIAPKCFFPPIPGFNQESLILFVCVYVKIPHLHHFGFVCVSNSTDNFKCLGTVFYSCCCHCFNRKTHNLDLPNLPCYLFQVKH